MRGPEEIKWRSGYRIDWSDPENVKIRDDHDNGAVVFEHLLIRREDLDRLVKDVT